MMPERKMNVLKHLYKKKYKNDTVYQDICREYISLESENVHLNNHVLKMIMLDQVIPKMAEVDESYENLFETVLFRGSFYKRLKISKPDEYDLLLVINLPIDYNLIEAETSSCKAGFTKLRVLSSSVDKNDFIWSKILTEDNYLDQNKFREWIHSVLIRALNSINYYKENKNSYAIKTRRKLYIITFRQNNPAFTLEVKEKNADDSEMISFDLIPCLQFKDKILPGFKLSKKNIWTVVAKPIQNEEKNSPEILWRPSFYEDEKEHLKGQIKPIIRMIKKLRDSQQWKELKSYYIETFFLHELSKNSVFKNNYEGASRTCIFIYMIKRLQQVLQSGNLYNFWNSNNNLLEKTKIQNRIMRIANELDNIIKIIDSSITTKPRILLNFFNHN